EVTAPEFTDDHDCELMPSHATLCVTPVVRRSTRGLFLDDGLGDRQAVSTLPSGYRRLDHDAGRALVGALQVDGSKIWALVGASAREVRCVGWQTSECAAVEGEIRGRLRVLPGSPLVDYDFRFLRPPTTEVTQLILRQWVWKSAERVMRPLFEEEDTATLAQHVLDADIVGVGPDHLERWFLSEAACEEARLNANQRLAEAPWELSSLGIHPGQPRSTD
ncbi:MAG: hypothetical protein KC731_04380, partial [Myxococcales bacterium]|nr:hypothetical protein [Myxococcales bacterium]